MDASPAAGAVVRDDGLEYLQQCGLVDRVAAVDLQDPGCRVAVSLVDDAVRVGHGGVVDEDVGAILSCEQGAYIALKREVGSTDSLIVSSTSGSASCTSSRTCRQTVCCQSGSRPMYSSTRESARTFIASRHRASR